MKGMNYIRMRRVLRISFAVVGSIVAMGMFFVSCAPQSGKGPIVVASKIDTEGGLLGTMIVQVLENEGFEVDDRTQFGTTDVIRKAISSGEIDIYPEYTGNGAFFYPGEIEDNVWKNGQQGYDAIRALDQERIDVVWLTRAEANNTWAIAIREDVAASAGLVTLSDLGRYISAGGEFKIAASEEFITRPDVLPAFESTYGFALSEEQILSFSGGNTALTEKAAADQTEGVNAAMAYGTDGQLSAFNLVVLEDDRGVQPVYEPAPIIRAEVLDQYPEIADLLAPVFNSLDLTTLQRLNASIAVEGNDVMQVARQYLTENGFI